MRDVQASSALLERVIRVRRQLHRDPELSNAEYRATALLRQELEDLGVDVVGAVGETGVVAEVAGSGSGPTVVVRADMDALPIQEQTDFEFRSTNSGVMHACGHDVHSAVVLGVAGQAHEMRERINGRLRFIFQPAEEAEPLGGRAVVEAGWLDDVAAAVAIHVDPDIPVGTLGLRLGPTMASSDEVEIVVHGRSSHAGWPHVGIDAVAASASVVSELHKVMSRRLDPRSPVALNLGVISGGTAANVLADEVRINGTIRALNEALRLEVRDLVDEVATAAAATSGAKAVVSLTTGEPPLVNHPAVVETYAQAAMCCELECQWLHQPVMASEDFAFYAARIPAAMAWLGVRNESLGTIHPLHHPRFAIDEAAIPAGIELLTRVALMLLETPPTEPGRES